jgi:hypothetical protein
MSELNQSLTKVAKQEISRRVALLHDCPLWERTIAVRMSK